MNTKTANCNTSRNLTFQDMVDEFFNFAQTVDKTARTQVYDSRLKANISEVDDKYVISLAIPGVSKSEINLEVKDQSLTIAVPKQENNEEVNFKWREFDYSTTKRTFKLSNAIDTSSIKAEMANGILTITLTKKPAFVPKTITIK